MTPEAKRRLVLGATIAPVVLGVVVLLLLVTGVAHGFAQGKAEDRVRDRVGDDGAKVVVEGSTMKLIRGKADRVDVDTPTVAGSAEAPLGQLLEDAKKVDEVDARIGRIQVQGLTLRNMRVRVQDGRVEATANLSIKALTALVPVEGATLRALEPGADGAPRFAASVDLPFLGRQTVNAAVAAVDGAVQVAAEDLPVPLAITVFQDPSIAVTAVEGRASGDRLRISFSGTVN